MIGIKQFFKYFWDYFKSKGCVVKWIVVTFSIVGLPVALAFSIMIDDVSIWMRIAFFLCMEVFIISPFAPIIAIILGRRLAKFRKEVDKLSYNDLKNKKEYYRDFLENYSPAVLSYIDDFHVGEEDIIATVLNLELKGKIRIGQDGIEVISTDDTSLESNERYVLSSIVNKFFNPPNMVRDFQNYTENDANAHGLLCKQKVRRKGIIRSSSKGTGILIIIFILIEIVMNLIFSFFESLSYSDTVFEILCMIFCVPILLMVAVGTMYPTAMLSYFFFAYRQTRKETTFYRTEKAEKINENIEGLKNFLKDYTLLSERERNEIALWDRYLVYSVMLGQNKLIVKDFEKYYN